MTYFTDKWKFEESLIAVMEVGLRRYENSAYIYRFAKENEKLF